MGEHDATSRPDEATHQAEDHEANAEHAADRPPTEDEEKAAPGRDDLGKGVKEHEKDMAEKGANVKGEGELP